MEKRAVEIVRRIYEAEPGTEAIKDGKAVFFEGYQNRDKALAAVGLAE